MSTIRIKTPESLATHLSRFSYLFPDASIRGSLMEFSTKVDGEADSDHVIGLMWRLSARLPIDEFRQSLFDMSYLLADGYDASQLLETEVEEFTKIQERLSKQFFHLQVDKLFSLRS